MSDAQSDQGGQQFPVMDDVVNMNIDTSDDDERMYLVLFEEDYDDILIDREDSVALLVDNEQAVEVLKLASEVVGELAPASAPDKEPIQAMIDDLKEVRDAE